jgi:hypothetical protein
MAIGPSAASDDTYRLVRPRSLRGGQSDESISGHFNSPLGRLFETLNSTVNRFTQRISINRAVHALGERLFVNDGANRPKFSRDGFLNSPCNSAARYTFNGFAIDGLVYSSNQRRLIDRGTETVLQRLLIHAAPFDTTGGERERPSSGHNDFLHDISSSDLVVVRRIHA